MSHRPGTVAGVDDQEHERALRRIRGLLDKAGSTSFGPEADALYDKAAELMAKHRIDAALLEASRPAADRSPVVERPVDLGSGQYVRARLQLIHHVALHHGCRLLTHTTREGRVATVVGVQDDCERVELLYTSLLLQATRLAGAAWAERRAAAGRTAGPSRGRRPAPSQVAWKREFMFGFGARVGERLGELAEQAEHAARAANGGGGGAGRGGGGAGAGAVALVLADRSSRVDEWLARAYPRVRTLAPASGFAGHGGVAAGRTSADQADLGGRSIEAGRRALRR